jgi:hypothetical protein
MKAMFCIIDYFLCQVINLHYAKKWNRSLEEIIWDYLEKNTEILGVGGHCSFDKTVLSTNFKFGIIFHIQAIITFSSDKQIFKTKALTYAYLSLRVESTSRHFISRLKHDAYNHNNNKSWQYFHTINLIIN